MKKPLNTKELTVEQKIGQLMVARPRSYDENWDQILEMIRRKSLGGVSILPELDDPQKRILEVLEAADYPILICADMENGLPCCDHTISSTMAIAALKDGEESAYRFASTLATDAKKIGYNTAWGPVVDVIDGDAVCKVTRTFGDDPEYVSKLAIAMMRGFRDNGFIGCEKHFPAAIDMNIDTHLEEGASERTVDDILCLELIPYLQAMEDGVLTAVMSSHTRYAKIDPDYPASLSKKIISILRSRGFDGLMFTDSLAMMAILQNFNEKDVYGIAVAAGNDLILPNLRVPFMESYNHLLRCYKDGMFDEERLNDAVRHVIAAQEFTQRPLNHPCEGEEADAVVEHINRDGICALTDEGILPSLDDGKKKLFVLMCQNLYDCDGVVRGEIYEGNGINEDNYNAYRQSILQRYPDAEVLPLCHFPSPAQNQAVSYASTKAEEVIFVTYVNIEAYQGCESLTQPVISLMRSMQKKISAIVHLGNPYAIKDAPHVPRRIFSFGWGNSFEYLMDVLTGKYSPEGKLPMYLDLK